MKIPLSFIFVPDRPEGSEASVNEIEEAVNKIVKQQEIKPPELLGEFLLEDTENGGIRLSYEDYNVAAYSGADVEVIYTLNREGRAMLETALSRTCSGTLEEMLVQEFGPRLNKNSIYLWMQARKIPFEHFVWISSDD